MTTARPHHLPGTVVPTCPTGVHGVSHGVATFTRDIHDARRSVNTLRMLARFSNDVSRVVTVPLAGPSVTAGVYPR